MHSIKINHASRELGKDQGFAAIWIRDTIVNSAGDGGKYPCMETAFTFSPEDIQKILAGQPLILRILGTQFPPINVEIGDNISEEEVQQLQEYHREIRRAQTVAKIKGTLSNLEKSGASKRNVDDTK